jgi:hypothetical protein
MARVFFRYLLPTEQLQGVGEPSGEASSLPRRGGKHVTFHITTSPLSQHRLTIAERAQNMTAASKHDRGLKT